jgi:hypothetical protein
VCSSPDRNDANRVLTYVNVSVEIDKSINLSRATQLRSVYFEEQVENKRGSSLNWLQILVCQIPSSKLEEISFGLRMPSQLEGHLNLDAIQWSLIDSALSMQAGIRQVTFDFFQTEPGVSEMSAKFIKAQLPELRDLGLLHFVPAKLSWPTPIPTS